MKHERIPTATSSKRFESRATACVCIGLSLALLLFSSEVAGAGSSGWRTAQEVPGVNALNVRGHASVQGIACLAASSCDAAGYYLIKPPAGTGGVYGLFVVKNRSGVWEKAHSLAHPGVSFASPTSINALSCSSVGNCALGGSAAGKGFLASEIGGVWSAAIKVPWLGSEPVQSISCGAPGDCVAVEDFANGLAGFSVESHGSWGPAIQFPGISSLGANLAEVTAVSCSATANCSVGGTYRIQNESSWRPFVAIDAAGIWSPVQPLSGFPPNLDEGDPTRGLLDSMSCTAPGMCSAGGSYSSDTAQYAFVADEVDGIWRPAQPVTGLATSGESTLVISCTGPGFCTGGGTYIADAAERGFVVSEAGGVWGSATPLPGWPDEGGVRSLSCSSVGNCAAVGSPAPHGYAQTFGALEVDGKWHPASLLPGTRHFGTQSSSAPIEVSCSKAGTCAAGGDYEALVRSGRRVIVGSEAFLIDASL
jgi:hypothetical protein